MAQEVEQVGHQSNDRSLNPLFFKSAFRHVLGQHTKPEWLLKTKPLVRESVKEHGLNHELFELLEIGSHRKSGAGNGPV